MANDDDGFGCMIVIALAVGAYVIHNYAAAPLADYLDSSTVVAYIIVFGTAAALVGGGFLLHHKVVDPLDDHLVSGPPMVVAYIIVYGTVAALVGGGFLLHYIVDPLADYLDSSTVVAYIIVYGTPLFLIFIPIVVVKSIRAKRKARWELIEKHEKEGSGIIESLEAKYKPEPKPKPPPKVRPEDEAKLKALKLQLANRKNAMAALAAAETDISAEGIGKAVAEIQMHITALEGQIAELSPQAPSTESTPTVEALSQRALLDEAMSRCPDNAYLYCRLAFQLYRYDRNYDKALDCTERALQLLPNYYFALCTRAVIREHLADFNGAIQDYRAAIRETSRPSLMRTYKIHLARLYNEQDRPSEAIAVLTRDSNRNEINHLCMLDLADDNRAHNQLAIAHAKLGDHEAEFRHLDIIAESTSDRPDNSEHYPDDLYFRRAKLLFARGNKELAARDLKRHKESRYKRSGYDITSVNIETHDLLIELEPKEPKHYCDRAQRRRIDDDYQGMAEDKHRAIELYRDRRDWSNFVDYVSWLLLDHDRIPKDLLPPKQTIDLGREAIEKAKELGDTAIERAVDVLKRTFYFAMAVQEHDQAISLALEFVNVAIAHTELPNSEYGYSPGYAYRLLMRSYFASGSHTKAIETGLDALEHDGEGGIQTELFDLVNQLREIDEQEAFGCFTEVKDRLTEFQDNQFGRFTHAQIAEIHATWRDPRVFDLEEAYNHAFKAWSLSDRGTDTAAIFWAVCEAKEKGSGKEQIEEYYPDPIVYRQIEDKGRDLLTEWELIET